jgi:hypothetical protein
MKKTCADSQGRLEEVEGSALATKENPTIVTGVQYAEQQIQAPYNVAPQQYIYYPPTAWGQHYMPTANIPLAQQRQMEGRWYPQSTPPSQLKGWAPN